MNSKLQRCLIFFTPPITYHTPFSIAAKHNKILVTRTTRVFFIKLWDAYRTELLMKIGSIQIISFIISRNSLFCREAAGWPA
jgi:hypothetical protein